MAYISGASLQPIVDRLNAAEPYHPLEANTFADWSLEAGDTVTVSRDGVNYVSPVHTSRLVWKKQAQVAISATGNESREAISRISSRKYRGGSSSLRNTHYQHIYVDDMYNQMRSGLELTGSTASLYVQGMYNQMKAGLDLTSSTASLYVQNMYKQMKAGLDLTSSSASLYVQSLYKQMKAGLDLTSSSASLYVRSLYDQMQAGLDLTSSSASFYVQSLYKQMKAGLDLTSSSAAVYVRNLYKQMKAGLELTESSARTYVENKTTKAELLLTINGAGKSEAKIEADQIKIGTYGNSEITLNDRLQINSNGLLSVPEGLVCGANVLVGPTGTRPGYHGNAYGSFYYVQQEGTGENAHEVPHGIVKRILIENNVLKVFRFGDSTASVDVSVANNTLTFTDHANGTTLSFNKAVTLSGAWDGNLKFTYGESLHGQSKNTALFRSVPKSDITWTGTSGAAVIKAIYDDNDEPVVTVGTIYVNGEDVYADAEPASGSATGRHGSGYSWDFTITKGDGTTKNLTIDCSNIYSDARSGYSQGTYTQQTIVLQGSPTSQLTLVGQGEWVFRKVTTGGAYYYLPGLTVSLYPGNGGAFTPQGSAGPKLFHWGQHTILDENLVSHTEDFYYVSNSNRAVQYYNPGSGTKYDRGSSTLVTPIGSTYIQIDDAWMYTAGNTVQLYNAGTISNDYYLKTN